MIELLSMLSEMKRKPLKYISNKKYTNFITARIYHVYTNRFNLIAYKNDIKTTLIISLKITVEYYNSQFRQSCREELLYRHVSTW